MTTSPTRLTGVTSTSEADLWLKLRKHFYGAERIENSVKTGQPDICYPTSRGWQWLELKIRLGNYFYLQKSQLAFIVRILRLPPEMQHNFLVWDPSINLYQVLAARKVFTMMRRPYGDKIQVEIDDSPWVDIVTAARQLDAY